MLRDWQENHLLSGICWPSFCTLDGGEHSWTRWLRLDCLEHVSGSIDPVMWLQGRIEGCACSLGGKSFTRALGKMQYLSSSRVWFVGMISTSKIHYLSLKSSIILPQYSSIGTYCRMFTTAKWRNDLLLLTVSSDGYPSASNLPFSKYSRQDVEESCRSPTNVASKRMGFYLAWNVFIMNFWSSSRCGKIRKVQQSQKRAWRLDKKKVQASSRVLIFCLLHSTKYENYFTRGLPHCSMTTNINNSNK